MYGDNEVNIQLSPILSHGASVAEVHCTTPKFLHCTSNSGVKGSGAVQITAINSGVKCPAV